MPKLALFRQPKLRKKLLFTLMVVVLFRFGMELPVPGVNRAALGTALVFTGPLATLTGGALGQLSVFALGVYPFLLATVVVSFLVTAVPRLGTMANDSVRGAQRIQQYTRVFAAVVAVLEATAVIAYAATTKHGTARGQPVLAVHGLFPLATMVICMAAGAVVVMGLAEAISDNGLGRGVAILLATQIASVLPKEFWEISKSKGFGVFTLALVVVLATVVFKIFLDGAQRRIRYVEGTTQTTRRLYPGTRTYIPLRVSQQETAIYDAAGLLFLPVLATRLWPGITWLRVVEPHMREESDPWYLSAYILLIVIFTFVEAWIIVDPAKLADRMKKEGLYIPYIRPVTPTRQYLTYVLDRLTVVTAVYLVISALIPIFGFAMLGTERAFPFGGEAVVLLLAISIEAATDIRTDARLASGYESFLRLGRGAFGVRRERQTAQLAEPPDVRLRIQAPVDTASVSPESCPDGNRDGHDDSQRPLIG
jgi:preprotein translocase subunit SecY